MIIKQNSNINFELNIKEGTSVDHTFYMDNKTMTQDETLKYLNEKGDAK